MGGDYEQVQCHGSFCFCVDKSGKEIPGTRMTKEAGMPVCNRNGEKTQTNKQTNYRIKLQNQNLLSTNAKMQIIS